MRFLTADIYQPADAKIVWKDFQVSFTRLFDVLLLFHGVVAVLLVLVHFFSGFQYNHFFLFNLFIAVIALLLFFMRKRVSAVIKLWVLTSILCFLLYIQFSYYGSAGSAFIYLLSLQILQVVFYSFRKALPILIAGTLSALVIGILSHFKIIVYYPHLSDLMQTFGHWLNIFVALFYFTLVSGITILGMKERMLASLNQLKKSNDTLRAHENDLKQLAYYDQLTRLPNKFWFNQELSRRLEENSSLSGCLILAEIVNFRTVNSLLGPERADNLLKIISNFFRSYSKGELLLGRLNGVEFISWAEGWSEETLRRNVHAFRPALKHRIQEKFPGLPFDITVAAVRYPQDASNLSDLHQKCVTAMTEAQLHFREDVVFFKPSMIEGLNREFLLQNALTDSINNDGFLLYYQEQLNIRTNTVVGLEVLARWQDRENCFISPGVFIPILTKHNLIIRFSRLIFTKVLKDMPLVFSRYGQNIKVSINISPVFFLSEGFSIFIGKILSEYDVPPSSITLEITEDVFIEDLSIIRGIIAEVKALGFSVSLDDFGKGFSSLSYLSSLPLDEVKIDKEFIKNILEDAKQFGVVKSICDLAKILGYKVVIEGIETEEQVHKIRQTSCDLVQGYFYSRPAPLKKEPSLSL